MTLIINMSDEIHYIIMIYEDNIQEIIEILNDGGVILHPTDTVWGLGCSMMIEEAVEKIYTLKNRKREKQLILLVSNLDMLTNYIGDIHPRIDNLLFHFERPLTVVYDNHKNIPKYLASDNESIAIRIVQDIFCKDIIEALGHPLVSTSANKSNNPTPHSRNEIDTSISKKVDFIAKHRKEEIINEEPSVVIRCNHRGKIEFIRS